MKNKPIRLTKGERELESDINQGLYVSVDDLATERTRYAKAAKATFAKQGTGC